MDVMQVRMSSEDLHSKILEFANENTETVEKYKSRISDHMGLYTKIVVAEWFMYKTGKSDNCGFNVIYDVIDYKKIIEKYHKELLDFLS